MGKVQKKMVSLRKPGTKEKKSWGEVLILHETESYGVYLLRIKPGASIPKHYHLRMEESEIVVTKGLMRNGKKVIPFKTKTWKKKEIHDYVNNTNTYQEILCVNAPPFDMGNEIEVAAPRQSLVKLSSERKKRRS